MGYAIDCTSDVVLFSRRFDVHQAPFPHPNPLLAPPSPPAMPDNRPYPAAPTTPTPPKASSAQCTAACPRAWWCCMSDPYTTGPAGGASGVCRCHMSLPAPMCCADPGDGNSGLTRRTAPPATTTMTVRSGLWWHGPLPSGMARRRRPSAGVWTPHSERTRSERDGRFALLQPPRIGGRCALKIDPRVLFDGWKRISTPELPPHGLVLGHRGHNTHPWPCCVSTPPYRLFSRSRRQ